MPLAPPINQIQQPAVGIYGLPLDGTPGPMQLLTAAQIRAAVLLPSVAPVAVGAALLAQSTDPAIAAVWSPSPVALLPDILPVTGTLLSYGSSRQLQAGGAVSHSGSLSVAGAISVADGTIASPGLRFAGSATTGLSRAASSVIMSFAGTATHQLWSGGSLYMLGSDPWLQVGSTTPPVLKRASANTLGVYQSDGTTLGGLSCGSITASGIVSTGSVRDTGFTGDHYLQSITRDTSGNYYTLNANGLSLGNTSSIRGFSTLSTFGAHDTTFSRSAPGVWQIGTTANNALGSLNLANLTASSNVSVSSGADRKVINTIISTRGIVYANEVKITDGSGDVGSTGTINTIQSSGSVVSFSGGLTASGNITAPVHTFPNTTTPAFPASGIVAFCPGSFDVWFRSPFGSCYIQIGGGSASNISSVGTMTVAGTGGVRLQSNPLASGPSVFLKVPSTSAINFRNTADSADIAVTCGAITASGPSLLQNSADSVNAFQVLNAAGSEVLRLDTTNRTFIAGGDAFAVRSATGGAYIYNGGFLAATNASNASSAVGDTFQSRASAGVWRFGTTSTGSDAGIQCGSIAASGSIQDTPRQSTLNPTVSDIPTGKAQDWYNSVAGEYRRWVNIGGTLLKSAAYT